MKNREFRSTGFFLCAAIFFCQAIFGAAVESNSALIELRKKVPRELLPETTSLSPEQNAAIEWSEAAAKYVRPVSQRSAERRGPLTQKEFTESVEQEAMERRNERALQSAFDFSIALPQGPHRQQLDEWLSRNELTFALLERGLAKGKFEFLRDEPPLRYPRLNQMSDLLRARSLIVKAALEKEDLNQASKLVLENFRIAKMISKADATFIEYMWGNGARHIALKQICNLARRKNIDVVLVEQMLAAVEPNQTELDDFKRHVRTDFIETVLPSFCISPTNETVILLTPEPLEKATRLILNPALLTVHPQPLDTDTTMARIAAPVLRMMDSAKPNVKSQQEAYERELQANTEALLKELGPLLKRAGKFRRQLSAAEAKRLAPEFKKITNPFGKLLLCLDFQSVWWKAHSRVIKAKTVYEAGRAVLAIRLFQLKYQRLPMNLEELVEKNLLPAVPFDAFSDMPLGFDPHRAIIWSIGEDQVNDGGNGLETKGWSDKDTIWSFAEIPE
jgi:hypothetical protein